MTDFEKIVAVLRKHHLMTLATTEPVSQEAGSGEHPLPWVAHVFYAWVAELGCFVFTSDPATRHGREMTANSSVAGGVALETRNVGRIQGVQIEGVVRRAGERPDAGGDLSATGEAEREKARRAYLKRFPYAVVVDLNLWLLQPTLMKLTDNTLGFGSKLVWER